MKWYFTGFLLLFSPLYLWAQQWQQQIARQPNADFFQIQRAFNQEWENRPSEKGKGYKPLKRWEWFWEQRVGKSGKLPQGNIIMHEWENYRQTHPKAALLNRQLPAFQLLQQSSVTPLSLPKGNWKPLGPNSSPGGYSGIGRINCIGFHPTDPNTFWVGSPAGGLWKTTDGGKTWATYTDNLPVLGVTSIAVDYTNPKIIYIATGDGDNAYGIPGQPSAGYTQSVGVLKSTDGGVTWKSTDLHWDVEQTYLIGTLLIHPVYPNILLAATSDGIYKTENGGDTWKKTQSGHFQDMKFKPGEPSTVYATTFSWGGGAQIFKSTDTGATWKQATEFAGLLRISLAVTEANPAIVYAFCANRSDNGFGGFYQSDNSGKTFTLAYAKENKNLLGWSIFGSDKGGQGWYDLAIAASPTDQNVVYVGGVNNWKTVNGGKDWEINNIWYSTSAFPTVHADKHFLAFHPIQTNILFEGNDGGIYKTTNGGVSWTDLSNGLQITQFYRLGLSATQPNIVIAGAQDNGTKKFTNNTWAEASGGDGMECLIDPTDADIMYATSQNGTIYQSNNGFKSSINISSNIPGNPSGAWVTPVVMDPVDPKTLYAGYRKLYKTTNRGQSWTSISDDFDYTLQSLAVASSDPKTIYAGSSYQLYATHDGGKNWQALSEFLPNQSSAMTYIAVHAQNPTTLWITYSGYDEKNKVFQSDDGGKTWKNISGTLPNLPVNCIVFQQGSAEGLYIGTDVGVFYRNRSMSDWEVYSEGLPNVIVTELEIHEGAQKIRAATFGRGLWEGDLLPGDPFLPILESDSLALVALYNSTDGKNWKKKQGWLTKPVREWQGITTEGNRVKEISLATNNLTGSIPPALGDLEQLSLLSLTENQIGGNLPPELGKLKNLLFLYLNENLIAGNIPAEMGNLENLKELILGKNKLAGKLPAKITQLTKLGVLDIAFNKITDAIPENIDNLEKLRIINFQENLLSGKVPESVGSLSELSVVNLSHNTLEGNFPPLNYPVQEMLDISHNAFTSLPSLTGKIKGTLKVTHNALTFEDIVPNLEIKNFTYEPQREIGEEKNIMASEGDAILIDLNIDEKVNSNQYTWFKDGKEIEKSNKNQFVIKAVKLGDAGVYTCAIDNTKAKELTIYSKPVTLTVDNRLQFITLADIPDKTYGDPPFEISATASSGLPVKYILVAGPATLAGKTITLTGVGTVTIRVEQEGNENYKTAEPVERSFPVGKASQTLTFADPENKVFADPPFELSATSSSGLPVSFSIVSGPASLSGKTLNLEGAGKVTVQALQPGNANYKAAEPVERSFQIDKALQTINFTKPEDKTYLDPAFLLEATSSSGLPVTFTVLSGPAFMDTLVENRNTLHITGAGTVNVRAEQSGNENYKVAEAVERTFKVNKVAQTITFYEIDNKSPLDPPFALEALATSGLEVKFILLSGPAILDGNMLSLTGPGEIVVRAEQEGNENFLPADPITQNFFVLKGFQRITFPPLSDRIFGDEPFELTATASSGLPLQYSIVSGLATINEKLLTLTGAGMVTVRATQTGDSDFEPAEPAEQSFEVEKGFQTLTFDEVPDKTFGEPPFSPPAIASSGLPAVFTVISGPATVEENKIKLTGAGNVVMQATQPGNENYRPAEPVEQSFTVAKGKQTIDFASIPDKTFGDESFELTATASSGLAVNLLLISGPAALMGNRVNITSTGMITIRAEQPGNENYEPAEPVERSFNVGKASQTILFDPVEDKKTGDNPFTLSATASSGLAVRFVVDSGPATISGDILSLNGEAGEVTVTAMQEGNEHYEPASEVQQRFEVNAITGVEDEIPSAGVKMFPNPSKTQLYLEADMGRWYEGEVSVKDASGKNVANYVLKTKNLAIDLTGKSAGLYMVMIRKDQDSFIFRFVKE